MDDLISRQQTIDEIKSVYEWHDTVTMERLIEHLNNLPTIQPEKAQLFKEGATSDMISRQEAIDRFNVIRPVDPKKDEYTKGIDVGMAMCIVAVKDQPTVQPEPHEGHWIWVAGELMCSKCRTIYSDLYPDYDNAVACPHCGARMTTSK